MVEMPSTRESLLIRIRDPRDEKAWPEFVDIYGPLVYHYARDHGLQDADAADLTQDVFRAVAVAIRGFQYDRAKGAFRSWLFTVARTKLLSMRDRMRRQPQGSGDPAQEERLNELPDRDGESLAWDRSYRQRLLDWAAEQVRHEVSAQTWQAFWRTAIEHADFRDVANELGMSIGAVYAAKNRVLTRIRDRIRQIQDDEIDL